VSVSVSVAVAVVEVVTETVSVPETVAAAKHAGNTAHRGVPGTVLCRYNLPAPHRAAHDADAGQPSGTKDPGRRRMVLTQPASSSQHVTLRLAQRDMESRSPDRPLDKAGAGPYITDRSAN